MSHATKTAPNRENPNTRPASAPKTRAVSGRSGSKIASEAAGNSPIGKGRAKPKPRLQVFDPTAAARAESPEFAGFAEVVLLELAPVGELESIAVGLVARAAFKPADAGPLVQALDALAKIRALKSTTWGRPTPTPTPTVSEVPAPPFEPLDDPERDRRVAPYHVEGLDDFNVDTDNDNDNDNDPVDHEPIDGRWRSRLQFDPEVSETAPVVRGTWVTTSQVVSRVVDGWTWAEILRSYPELIEDDIRACLAYAVEQEDLEAA